jgi:hypothetical protein
MRLRYVRADRPRRSQLLDEMAKVTGLERKTLIRLLHGDLARHPRRKQRGRTYGPEVDDALCVLAESFDYLCAERLTSHLVWMTTCLAKHDELTASPALLEQMAHSSASTIRRIRQRVTQEQYRLPRYITN